MLTKNLKEKIAILSIALFLASNNAIGGTLVFIQKEYSLQRSSTEMILTLTCLTGIIFILAADSISKKIGLKNTVLTGLFFIFLSGILPIIFKSLISIIISRLILGIGVGLFNGNSANYINILYSGEEKAYLHGIRNSFEFIGQIINLFIAGFLIKYIGWIYAFAVYSLSIFIFIFFKIYVRDPEISYESKKINFSSNIVLFILFATIMVMNSTSIYIRFPFVASRLLGMDADINMYVSLIPLAGMISGFLFGYINRLLKTYTILFGIGLYVAANFFLAYSENSFTSFLIFSLLTSFAQSMCLPYIFVDVSRYVEDKSLRIATNLIFAGCNVGGLLSSVFLSTFDKITGVDSLCFSFISFSFLYALLFIIYFRRNVIYRRRLKRF